MNADEKRQAVARKYDELIGRNRYSQTLRDYCYRKYNDGNYYSDCSSSICYAYKEAGYDFGILNTAGIYQSARLVTVDVPIRDGQVKDIGLLREGDMLEFAGTDESRPQTIGHVEMVHTLNGKDTIICGHGSGRPSYKDMVSYCRQRQNTQTSTKRGNKGLVCVRRYILDEVAPEPPKKSGWEQGEDGAWSFYLGNTGAPVRNSWYLDSDGRWYWFDGAGHMVRDTWYRYMGDWYYLGSDGAMVQGQQTIDGKWYIMDGAGAMLTELVTLTPDQDGALRWTGLAD
ncbi:cell wall-binding protein [Enterocloster aldenensis]|uniref:Cell wall-binding protein n=1 Tax=Enterocloster aldenensis TaxID=358742 RepID=A0AAW5BX45_9FIRM|nr:cell wall-binding protein [Enterocloster aldenensis]